jgi:hypothetical protein
VDGEEGGAEAGGGLDGAGDGAGDIVEFEVEEESEAAFGEGEEGFFAGGGEEFEADFAVGNGFREGFKAFLEGDEVGKIECDDKLGDSGCWGGHGGRLLVLWGYCGGMGVNGASEKGLKAAEMTKNLKIVCIPGLL